MSNDPEQHELPRPHILLAEDDDALRELLASTFRQARFDVTLCRNGYELMDRLCTMLAHSEGPRIDIVVSDIRMPGASAMRGLEAMQNYIGFPPMILITAFGDAKTHSMAKHLGAVAVLDKPFALEDLLDAVRRALPEMPVLDNGDEPQEKRTTISSSESDHW